MADIELIIKIPEDIYKDIIENGFIYDEDNEIVTDVIKNGTPLVDVLNKIRAEIEGNMESIIGKYDSSIPKFNMPSYKIERNKAREECISIIDKYKAEGRIRNENTAM